MTKKLLIVHGMGRHDEASVRKEALDALGAAFGLYESLKGVAVEDRIEIVPLVYGDLLDECRKQIAASAGPIAERVAAVDASSSLPLETTRAINRIEMDLGGDDLLFTHWLDVILYRFTLLAEPIRLRIAEGIAGAIASAGAGNVHVLGHSLGTAVLHDTLAKSYGPDNLPPVGLLSRNLSPVSQKLDGVHMVANVSRALQTFVKAGSSIVRPGPLGCTSVFSEYRHKLDPIPRIRPFDPTDNGGWVDHAVFASGYVLLEPSAVTAANVHGLGHYLCIPGVHLPLFRALFRFRPSKAERETAEAAFFTGTAKAKAQALQAAFGDLPIGREDGARQLLGTARTLRNLVAGFGEKFE